MRNVFHRFLGHLDPAPVRNWSLILTFYGDCIMPRGGELWLKTLSDLFGEVDIKPNSVRAAMRRLEADGYLECRRIGRTSHYALSEQAEILSREAERLIYRARSPAVAAGWDVLLGVTGARERRALQSAGFRQLSSGVHMRPLQRTVKVPGGAIHLTARGDDADLARRLYPLTEIAAAYRAFSKAVPMIAEHAPSAGPLDALVLRLALVHAFRRIVLRDPHLAEGALPENWPADEAYSAFHRLYTELLPASDAWLDACARNSEGALTLEADRPPRFAGSGEPEFINV